MSDNDHDDEIARAASQFPDEQILAPPRPPRISVKRRRRTGTEPPKPRAGGLQTVVEVTMHTRQAQRLIEGREGADGIVPIMGLQEFGQRCRNIWMASAQDDPWADAALIDIEDRLDRAREALAEYHGGIRKTLEQDDRVKIGAPHSSAPVTYRFEFAAAHASSRWISPWPTTNSRATRLPHITSAGFRASVRKRRWRRVRPPCAPPGM